MAKIIDNPKGYKIIQTSRLEMAKAFHSPGICNGCNGSDVNGYLICVLNDWYCPVCYEEWIRDATPYEEDKPYELASFDYFKTVLFHGGIVVE